MKIHLRIFGFDFNLLTSIRKIKNQDTIGYTNRTKDGYYIPFLDYDNVPLIWIIPEIERLQKDFNLGTFHILQSSEESYHAVCIDRVTLFDFKAILRSSTVDYNFQSVPFRFGRKIWTLRLTDKSEKIKYLRDIIAPQYRKQSLAHAIILNNFFDIKIPKKQDTDEQKEVILSKYQI